MLERRPASLAIVTVLLLLSVAGGPGASAATAKVSKPEEKISSFLLNTLVAGEPTEMIAVLAPVPELSPASGIPDKNTRKRFVYDALRGSAVAAQRPLIAWLKSRGIAYRPFWIVNAVYVKADLSAAFELAARPEIERIVANPLIHALGETRGDEESSKKVRQSKAGDLNDGTNRASILQELPCSGAASIGPIEPCEFEPDQSPDLCRTADIDPTDASSTLVRDTTIVGSPTFESVLHYGSVRGFIGSEVPESGQAPAKSGHLGLSGVTSVAGITYGVAAINADDVWNMEGVRGEGIVVASCDTGVEWTHPAIQPKYRGWNGGTPDHSYSWHDAVAHTTTPLDQYGHGTHTTGTMVGDDGGANQIGVAPGARWIACRNMDLHGDGTPARYLECIEWALAPYPEGADPMVDGRPDLAADITNNSWGCPPSEGCDAFTLEKAFEAVRAAGQMTVAAAGNSGPSCSSVDDPPAVYDAVFSVGAVNSSIQLQGFSSRGPVTVDGSGRMKPNVAAPGSGVRSCIRSFGGPPQYGDSSGTSMASPHVTGAMALLWSAKPQLQNLIRISRCYVEQSAGPVTMTPPMTCGDTGPSQHPNNLWGWGLVDAFGATHLGPDSDGDGIANACDCAPTAGSSFDFPPEVGGDRFATDLRTFSWSSVAALAGPGTVYDVVRGIVSELRADAGFARATCRADNRTATSLDDPSLPPTGDAFYYLVRAQNACGSGSFGADSNGAPRTIAACP